MSAMVKMKAPAFGLDRNNRFNIIQILLLLCAFPTCASGSEELFRLRGTLSNKNNYLTVSSINHSLAQTHDLPPRLLTKEVIDSSSPIILSVPSSFQISMAVVLGIIILLQVYVITSFIVHRSKRVLEFAQPLIIVAFVGCGIVATCACYLFLWTSNVGCMIRDPIIFVSLTIMGSTIVGRAWRISSLMSNPLMFTGNGNDGNPSCVEKARQGCLRALTALSGCKLKTTERNTRSIRLQVSFQRMVCTITLLSLPQIIFQVLVAAIPALRSTETVTYSNNYGISIGRMECKSSAPGFWPIWLSIFFTAFPIFIALLLNVRPKAELDQIPDIINEYSGLTSSIRTFALVLLLVGPILGMAVVPNVRAYASISLVLGAALSLSYHIAFNKLRTINSSADPKRRSSMTSTASGVAVGADDCKSAAFAMKMVDMYAQIGQDEKCLQVVEETLATFKKGSASIIGGAGGKEQIGSGFTKKDLDALDQDGLQLIIRLLRAKGKVLIRLHGQSGMVQSANLNVDALRIFENCPASNKLQDVSIMFPIYSLVGAQLKGGVISDTDTSSLERDLAQRFCYEAQLQSYHFARALTHLAEMHGRVGQYEKAFHYFETMRAIYLPDDHPPLITAAFNQDKCAHGFSMSAMWYQQQGKTKKAVKRCDYVIKSVLSKYDHKDILGMYNLLLPLISVLRRNGEIQRAKQVFEEHMPHDASHSKAGVSVLRRPMCLLLTICDDATSKDDHYNLENIDTDVALALDFDVSDMIDNVFTANGWSMKSLIAEICLCLAKRLDPAHKDRKKLVRRGIRFAIVADERIKGSSGKTKHLVAGESHSGIYSQLLQLAENDAVGSSGTVYDDEEYVCETSNGSSSNIMSQDFSRRFVVKKTASSTLSNGSTEDDRAAPTHVSHVSKRKVSFSKSISSLASDHSSASNPAADSDHSTNTPT